MVEPFGSGIMPSSGADPQDFYYINYAMPGAYARHMYETRTCSPYWNVFGCRTAPGVVGQTVMPEEEAAPEITIEVTEEPEVLIEEPLTFWEKLKIALTGKAAEGADSPISQYLSGVLAGAALLGVGYTLWDRTLSTRRAEGDTYDYDISRIASDIDLEASELIAGFEYDDIEDRVRGAASEQLGVDFSLSQMEWKLARDVDIPISIDGLVYEKITA